MERKENELLDLLENVETERAVQEVSCSGPRVGCTCTGDFEILLCKRHWLVYDRCRKVRGGHWSSSIWQKTEFQLHQNWQ